MGYNTTVVVLNDRVSEIARDPEFGKKLADAISEADWPEKYRRIYVTGQTQVVETHHSSGLAIVAVGGNTGRVIGYVHGFPSDDEIIKKLERQRRERASDEKRREAAARR